MAALLAFLNLAFAPVPREPLPDTKSPGYIGVQFNPVGNGIQLSSIYADSPAERAELQVGDVITTFGGKPMGNLASVQTIILHTPPNTAVPIEVQRGDQTLKLKLRVGHRPADFPYTPPTEPDDEDPRP